MNLTEFPYYPSDDWDSYPAELRATTDLLIGFGQYDLYDLNMVVQINAFGGGGWPCRPAGVQ